MQFVKCPSCGKKYSIEETNCPGCGAFNMKPGQKQWELSEGETEEVFTKPSPPKPNLDRKVFAFILISAILVSCFAVFPMMVFKQIRDFEVSSIPEPEQVYVCPNGFVLEDGRCVQTIEEEITEYLPICGSWEMGHIYNPESNEQVPLENAEISSLYLFKDGTGYMYKNSEMEEIRWEYGEFDDVYSIYVGDTLKALAFLDTNLEVLTMQFLNSENILLLFR